MPTFLRNLKCIECKSTQGFTLANLLSVMSKDYVMDYWCDNCQEHKHMEFSGSTYELIDGQRIYNQLPFDE